MSILSNIKKYILGILIAEDETGNALIGSNPHYTISQHLAMTRQRGSKIGCYGCKILTWLQNKIFRIPGDHCTNAIAGFPEDLPTDG